MVQQPRWSEAMVSDIVTVAGATMPVPQFLALCAQSYRSDSRAAFEPSRDVFVAAGLAALREPPADWIQLGVTVGRSGYPALCREVAAVARRLRAEGTATRFFHMRKPPACDCASPVGLLIPANWRLKWLLRR
ncbi:MAG: hypothetical protein L0H64_04225 [Pseudonocardia sp.]|nr:hypothetical protein [Pseudonocardia sp.]